MKLILFSAKKQGGKNTAANMIKREFANKYGVVEINFADRLKEIVLELFVPAEWDWDIKDLDANKDKMLPLGKTVREALQWFGTDICRKAYPDVWVNVWRKHVKIYHNTEKALVLTADVRFANEVKAGQDLGGHVIRLLRAPFPDDKHESETALDMPVGFLVRGDYKIGIYHYGEYQTPSGEMVKIDAFVDNKNMTIAEQNEAVWKLVKGEKWL